MAYIDEELQDMEFEEALHNENRPFIRKKYIVYMK